MDTRLIKQILQHAQKLFANYYWPQHQHVHLSMQQLGLSMGRCSLRMAKGNQTGRMNGLKPQESATHSDRCAAQSTGHLAKPRPSGGNAIAIMQSSSRKAGGGSVCARPAHLNKAWNSIATGQNMGGGSHASGSPSSHV
jgi:hypothetical protein